MKTVNFILSFIAVFVIVYLSWVGAQFVLFREVEIDAIDVCVASMLTWYIARDVVITCEHLNKNYKK